LSSPGRTSIGVGSVELDPTNRNESNGRCAISGNESVHPGELNINDDKDLALALFDFINLIATEALALPKLVDDMTRKLPTDKLEAIARQDAPMNNPLAN
jgi:hypothetical protein